ncbi:unnamed protein product [Caenorhabditis angaria]|uniref:Major sperm protein n=1 Tax=Caenorhabditis angaria TaxID=860376 RepID=A0A9P1IF65_9PELO|nr:unnamed protein product [Caenorhabditis angaria]
MKSMCDKKTLPTKPRQSSSPPKMMSTSPTPPPKTSSGRDKSSPPKKSEHPADPIQTSPNSFITSRPGFPGLDVVSPTPPKTSGGSPPKSGDTRKREASAHSKNDTPKIPSPITPPELGLGSGYHVISPNLPPKYEKSAVLSEETFKSPKELQKPKSDSKDLQKPKETPKIQKDMKKTPSVDKVNDTPKNTSEKRMSLIDTSKNARADSNKKSPKPLSPKKQMLEKYLNSPPPPPISASQICAPREYPDSDDDLEHKQQQVPKKFLQYGTISNWQAENLELIYAKHKKFPGAEEVKEFSEKFNISQIDVEIWLETRREKTYKKYEKQGREFEPSVLQFYCDSMNMADGIRLEQPSIKFKSFFNMKRRIEIDARKEEEESLIPKLELSTNKIYLTPNREDKTSITLTNIGSVTLVYQICMLNNNEGYTMSPTCAILQAGEELTLNIVRKADVKGKNKEKTEVAEFFSLEYGKSPDGFLDAKQAAEKAQMDQREIVEIFKLDEGKMKAVK